MKILDTLQERHKLGKKSIAVLIDPDKIEDPARLNTLIRLGRRNVYRFLFCGW
jgi:predicted RND superfamily exporter protein